MGKRVIAFLVGDLEMCQQDLCPLGKDAAAAGAFPEVTFRCAPWPLLKKPPPDVQCFKEEF